MTERVFHYFEEISRVPRASWNTEGIRNYLVAFAEKQGLSCSVDEYDNVIIDKPASKGYEQAPRVILQGHTDMVAACEEGVAHDFEMEGLKLIEEGDFLRADGTTLGGDDGIAVAMALAVLEDEEMNHPALRVILTANEEAGLVGAEGLDPNFLEGFSYLINLDSEVEGKLLCGCAGNLNIESRIPMSRVEEQGYGYEIQLSGLRGGHSGMEIDKPRANANGLMGRILFELDASMPYYLEQLEGGERHNMIAASAKAVILTEKECESELREKLEKLQETFKREYAGEDDNLTITVRATGEREASVLHPLSRERITFFLMNQPHGVQKMSGTIAGLVETSANAAVMVLQTELFRVLTSIRSSVESESTHIGDKVVYLTEFLGGACDEIGAYPAWEYRKNSRLREMMASVWSDMYGRTPELTMIHAGLEPGIFVGKQPELDCISIGPDILDIHTPRERLSISSTKRIWAFLVHVLETIRP